MNTQQINNTSDPSQKLEKLHSEYRRWNSQLQFMTDEITFINRLLNSYVFEPNTPNLFERLQDYLERLEVAKNRRTTIFTKMAKYENIIGGILECKDDSCNESFYEKHDALKEKVNRCLDEFQNLKGEIFNYAGGILKRRKPKSST